MVLVPCGWGRGYVAQPQAPRSRSRGGPNAPEDEQIETWQRASFRLAQAEQSSALRDAAALHYVLEQKGFSD